MPNSLTPAQKRAQTLARKREREQEEGEKELAKEKQNRSAKVKATENKVWGQKRTRAGKREHDSKVSGNNDGQQLRDTVKSDSQEDRHAKKKRKVPRRRSPAVIRSDSSEPETDNEPVIKQPKSDAKNVKSSSKGKETAKSKHHRTSSKAPKSRNQPGSNPDSGEKERRKNPKAKPPPAIEGAEDSEDDSSSSDGSSKSEEESDQGKSDEDETLMKSDAKSIHAQLTSEIVRITSSAKSPVATSGAHRKPSPTSETQVDIQATVAVPPRFRHSRSASVVSGRGLAAPDSQDDGSAERDQSGSKSHPGVHGGKLAELPLRMDSDADGVGDVEMDSDIPPPKKKLKGKKAESNSGRSSQARREKFHRENAKWLEDDDPAPQAGSSRHGQRGVRHIKNESDNSGYDNEDEDDEEDEDNIELVYGPKAPIRIGDQRPRIRKVLRYAISVIHEKIIYQHAFPSADIGPRPWSCQALYDGARSFGYTDIQERILRDEKYMEDMAAVSDARAASIRKKARDAAIASVAAYYGLDRDCTKHVQELMADEQYIFPGDIKNQTINRARPFQHPAIIGLLRTFFGHNGELRRHPEKFVVEGEQEPQLPAAMVAFAATAIHFALQCHTRPEKSMRGVQFSAAMYTTIFDMHMSNLEETREEKPAKYRHLMSKLYTEVVGPDIVPIVRRKGNAKRLFDLEGMSE